MVPLNAHLNKIPASAPFSPTTQCLPIKRKITDVKLYSPSFYDKSSSLRKRIKKIEGNKECLIHANEAKKLTPIKKIPIVFDSATNQIKIDFSPNSKKELQKQQREAQKATCPKQTHFYRFKDGNGKTYVGLALFPLVRAKQHIRDAIRGDQNLFHQVLNQSKLKFTFGVYPYKVTNNRRVVWTKKAASSKRKLIGWAGRTEQILIKAKKSLFNEKGYNSNIGGAEGSKTKKKLNFNDILNDSV